MSERTVKMGGVPHPVVGEALQVGAIAPDFVNGHLRIPIFGHEKSPRKE